MLLGVNYFQVRLVSQTAIGNPCLGFSMLLQVRRANRLFPVKWWGAVSVWGARLCARMDLGITSWKGTLFRQVLRKGCSAWLELRNVSPPWLLWPWGPWLPCWPQPSHSITLCQLQLINTFWLCCLLYFWGRIKGTVHSIDRALPWGMSERSQGGKSHIHCVRLHSSTYRLCLQERLTWLNADFFLLQAWFFSSGVL